jgi:ubiquinone/menaquinone biosynthesis C-methylase UbiE
MSKKRNDYRTLVREHYRKEALSEGKEPTSTMRDLTIRRAEVAEILSYLIDGDRCLEVGCGNGFASVQIAKAKKLSMTCIDFSSELIALAKKQSTKGIKGTIAFSKQDILKLQCTNKYNVVFTVRCIINLLDWNDQKEALRRMARALKKGGRLILLEAYKDGNQELNRARHEIGLPQIPAAYHNLHLEKEKVAEYLSSQGLTLKEENNFLSTYYFGSRVLYPALAGIAKKKVTHNSAFSQFFANLPPAGNYSHIKILAFTKKEPLTDSAAVITERRSEICSMSRARKF